MADIYTPSQLAAEIDAIETGPDTSEDTITAADLAEGITAHDAEGEAITGTMPDLGNVAFGDSPDVTERGYIASEWLEGIAEAINIRVGRATQKYNIPIYVTAPIDSTVTAEKDGEVYYGVEIGDVEDGALTRSYALNVHTYGTYQITATTTSGAITNTQTGSVTITESSLALETAYLQLKWLSKDDNNNGEISTGLAPRNCVIETRVGKGTLMFAAGNYSYQVYVSPQSGTISINDPIRSSATYEPVDVADVEISLIDQNIYAKINGETVISNNEATISTNMGEFTIFYVNNMIYGGAAIYDYFKIYSDSEKTNLIAAFYPAKRTSDNKLGMYDTVRKLFFAADGYTASGGEVVS